MIEKYNFLLQITLIARGNGNIIKMTVLCYAGRQRKTVQKSCKTNKQTTYCRAFFTYFRMTAKTKNSSKSKAVCSPFADVESKRFEVELSRFFIGFFSRFMGRVLDCKNSVRFRDTDFPVNLLAFLYVMEHRERRKVRR